MLYLLIHTVLRNWYQLLLYTGSYQRARHLKIAVREWGLFVYLNSADVWFGVTVV